MLYRVLILYFLIISSALAQTAEELRDVRPPAVPYVFPWGLFLLGLLLAVVCLSGLVWIFLRWKNRVVAAVSITPWEKAEEQLCVLEKSGLAEAGQWKEFYSALSDVLRVYLEGRFAIKAPGMTTEEFLNFAKNSPVLRKQYKESLCDFLSKCDMVKFARYHPDPADAYEGMAMIRMFVRDTQPKLEEEDDVSSS